MASPLGQQRSGAIASLLSAAVAALLCFQPPSDAQEKNKPENPPEKKMIFRHPSIMVDEKEIKAIRDAVKRGKDPQTTAFNELMKAIKEYLQRKPQPMTKLFIPYYYENKEKHIEARGMMDKDCDAAYGLALAYQITGESRYAEKAIEYLMAWARVCKEMDPNADTYLNCSRTMVLMVYAADMVWNDKHFKKEDKEKFLKWSKESVHDMGAFRLSAGKFDGSNRGAWGIQAMMAYAILSEDEGEFDRLVELWKQHLSKNLNKEAMYTQELDRHDGSKGQGISYSQFGQQAYVLTAEMCHNYGVDLFGWKTADGVSLKEGAEKIFGWETKPDTFPSKEYKQLTNQFYSCWEILYLRYGVKSWGKKLEELRKPPYAYPFRSNEGGAWLTLTHGVPVK